MFERDWTGDKSRVIDKVKEGCEWVFAGEGIATRKIDGTSCLVRDSRLYKRREVRPGDPLPEGFEMADHDLETGKFIGWLPVTDAKDDKWHREAFNQAYPEGTYELVGPKIQGNPEMYDNHILVSHRETGTLPDAPRTFTGLKEYLAGKDIEGIVFHHPDGRMAKIKLKDFGLKRAK